MRPHLCLFSMLLVLVAGSGALATEPTLVADINTVVDEFDRPAFLTVLNNQILFAKESVPYGKELWRLYIGNSSNTNLPQLVKDINPGPDSAFSLYYSSDDTDPFEVAGSVMYFRADDGIHGWELWKTDGTTAGTVLVRDIQPGPGGAFSEFSGARFTAIGNIVYFVADDGASGAELWRSDGSSNGTYRVSDIVPGPVGSGPDHLTRVQNTLFFGADTGYPVGRELWKSDGTAAGTLLVKDVNPAPGYSGIYVGEFAAAGNLLYFVPWGSSSTFDPELWRSDGTAAGTYRVKDINPAGVSFPHELFAVGSRVYFFATDGVTGAELWKTDGTEPSTVLVRDINPGPGHSVIGDTQMLSVKGGVVYFFAQAGGPDTNYQLWKSNGTETGTVLVADLNGYVYEFDGKSMASLPGLAVADPLDPVLAVQNNIYFSASDGATGFELWRTDGGTNTARVADLNGGPGDSTPTYFLVNRNRLFLTAYTESAGFQIHRLTPPASLAKLTSLPIPTEWGYVLDVTETMAVHGEEVYFFAQHSGDYGPVGLFKTTGSAAGAETLKKEVLPANFFFDIYLQVNSFTNASGVPLTIFGSVDPLTGYEPWITDGTESGTRLLKDIWPGAGGSMDDSIKFIPIGSEVFFEAAAPATGLELWKTDGTEAGTVLVKDIWPGPPRGWLSELTAAGRLLFFRAEDGINGNELWRSDGTGPGTFMIELVPGPGSSVPGDIAAFGERVIFTPDIPGIGGEPWVSDGTAGGTFLVQDIMPGPDTSLASGYVPAGGTIYFRANDGVTGWELWKTDGTAGSAGLVRDFMPGPAYSYPFIWAHPEADVAIVTADDPTVGRELWKTDGTPSGTVLVKDIYPGPASSWPNDFAFPKPDKVVFSAYEPVHGSELWVSDFTENGTKLAADIYPGPRGGVGIAITTPAAEGGYVYFYADEGVHGFEVWQYKPD